MTETEIKQSTYPAYAEGTGGKLRLNRRGELVVPDFLIQLVLDGRVYNVSNAVLETAELFGETARGTNNINPSLLLDVPSGTTVIPLELIISTSGTGTAGDFDIQICTDDAVRYSSGGGALTPVNMRKDDPNTSACTAKSGSTQIVASGNTDDDTIYFKRFDSTEIATPGPGTPFVWRAKDHVPPVLIGPASLLIYVIVGNVDASFFYSLKYAEFSTTVA